MDDAEKDVFLYKKWKDTQSKTDFQNLYRHMLPAISAASMKTARNSQIPSSVFKLEAAQQFHNAINSYDPKYKTKLSSHVYGAIENKLKRINYKYQNIARITERSKGKGSIGVYHIQDLRNTEYLLEDKLGRRPSDVEVAQAMGVTVQSVGDLRNEIRKDLSLNETVDDLVLADDDSKASEIEYMIYYDLPPEAQLVYDLARGLHGKRKVVTAKGKTDWKAIGTQLGMSNSKVQKIKKMLAKELSRYDV